MSIFRIVGELNHFSPSLVIGNSLGYNFLFIVKMVLTIKVNTGLKFHSTTGNTTSII